MPASMLIPLMMMLLGFTLFFVTLLLIRLRGEILSRERTASWIREAVTHERSIRILRHGGYAGVRVALVCTDARGGGVEHCVGPAAAREITRRSAPTSRHEGWRRRGMTPRQRRMSLVAGIVIGVGIAGALALSAFRSNVTFFFDPTAGCGAEGEARRALSTRRHGDPGQCEARARQPGSSFRRHRLQARRACELHGVLPDLFREGTGVVAHGRIQSDGTFVADEVLAKHDEKYMPPEVAKSLKRRHGEAREDALSGTQATPAPEGQSQAGASRSADSAQPPSTTSNLGPPAAPSPSRTIPQASGALASTNLTRR